MQLHVWTILAKINHGKLRHTCHSTTPLLHYSTTSKHTIMLHFYTTITTLHYTTLHYTIPQYHTTGPGTGTNTATATTTTATTATATTTATTTTTKL
jgi:hypothetical protein